MRSLVTFTLGIALLLAQGSILAQIYETTDAAGNPVYTDAPVDSSSQEVGLPATNIADALSPAPEIGNSDDTGVVEPGPAAPSGKETFQDPNAAEWKERTRRVREEAGRDPSKPHEVLDAEPRHEVKDAEPRHEVH